LQKAVVAEPLAAEKYLRVWRTFDEKNSDSPADEAMREGVIAKIAKAVWDRWGN
jgi:hypothetical protein